MRECLKIHTPKTNYQKMIFDALMKKIAKNKREKNPSKRDDIRKYNNTHQAKLPLRRKTGFHNWEEKILSKPGAPERVRVTEDEFRVAQFNPNWKKFDAS